MTPIETIAKTSGSEEAFKKRTEKSVVLLGTAGRRTMSGEERVIMVTGGTGMVGSALKAYIESLHNPHERWVFLGKQEGDLRSAFVPFFLVVMFSARWNKHELCLIASAQLTLFTWLLMWAVCTATWRIR